LSYNTSAEQLRNVVAEIKHYGETHPKKNDEVNVAVNNFGTYAIEVMIEIYLHYEDWETYVVSRNEIVLAINDIVRKNNIEFAVQTGVVK
jgi:small-conductance mechanosensitive channel